MRICVFLSAADLDDRYTRPAREFAKLLGEGGHTLVWGGSVLAARAALTCITRRASGAHASAPGGLHLLPAAGARDAHVDPRGGIQFLALIPHR